MVSRALLAVISLALALVVVVAGVALLNPADDEASSSASGQAATGEEAQSTVPSDAAESDSFLSGFNLTAYTTGGYAGPAVDQDLDRLKQLGSNTVVLVPTWYMKQGDSNRIAPDDSKTPDDAGLSQAISSAREAGLEVMLKPHVDVLDGTFRGEIEPSDRAAWFSSYESFIGRYADLAASGGAEMFSVGTELKSLSTDTEAWNSVIETVRPRFGGELTYSANWDEVWQVQFWDRLDMIGVDAYFPLSQEGEQPTAESLAAAWQPNVDGLAALSEQQDLPVLLTEIGYPSQAGSTAHPWEVRQGDPPDQDLQALAYQAAYDAFADQPWLRGLLWWSWRADPKAAEQMRLEYSPEGKPAEDVFKAESAS